LNKILLFLKKMSNSDDENQKWDRKEYYAKNEDDDFIEEEQEAIKIQQRKLQKLMNQKLLKDNENNDLNLKENNEKNSFTRLKNRTEVINKLLVDSDDENQANESKSKLSAKEKIELEEMVDEVKKTISEIKTVLNPLLSILKNTDIENPLTVEYLQKKKFLNKSYLACLNFFIVNRVLGKIDSFHPCLKKIVILRKLLEKLEEDKKLVIGNIDKLVSKLEELQDLEDEEEIVEESEEEEDFYYLKKKKKHTNEEPEITVSNKIKSQKEIMDKKNQDMITNANKALAAGKGMYRKRKRKQGNAKLMNKMKYQKKEKIRKNYVKEFTEKPLVYTGEATGIRRDLVRSTKLS